MTHRGENQDDVIEAFDSTSRYLDDLLNIDNPYFEESAGSEAGPAEISSTVKQDDTYEADGFIFVSTEHKGCIPPSFTSVLYQFGKEYFYNKPSALVVYSEDYSGAGRAAKLLRAICGELGCGSVKKIFGIPEIQNNLDSNGVPSTEAIKHRLEKNFATCLEQLYWTATAYKEHRITRLEADTVQTASPMKVIIFLSSTRDGRLADRVLKFVKPRIKSKFEVKIHDPLEMPYPVLRKPAYEYKDTKEVPLFLVQAQKEIDAADGFVFISTEYHSDIPPALSNMACHFPVWNFMYKPSAIVTYSEGHFGGVRAGLDLRTFSSELGCGSVPATVCIPLTQDTLDENGVPATETIKSTLERDMRLVMEQLEYHARALKTHRSKVKPPPFSHPTRG